MTEVSITSNSIISNSMSFKADGKELTGVRSCIIEACVDDAVRATIELCPSELNIQAHLDGLIAEYQGVKYRLIPLEVSR